MQNTCIYTDASKIGESRVGIAGVKWQEGRWQVIAQKSLPKENSVFTGELTAIKEALLYIKNNQISNGQISKIKSDSKSAIQAIADVKNNDKTVFDIRKTIEDIRKSTLKKIKIAWVRGHSGEEGNEAADRAAKEAIQEGELADSNKVPRNVVKIRLLDKYKSIWNREWEEANTGRATYHIFNKVEFHSKYRDIYPETHRKLLNRAASGHFPVNAYLKRIQKRETDKCNYCNNKETIEHLLVKCPRFESIRFIEIGLNRIDELKAYLTVYTGTAVRILKMRMSEGN